VRCKRHSGLSLVGCRAMTSCTDSSAVPPPRPGCASVRGWWATWRSGTIESCCTPRLHHRVRLDGAVDANVDLIEHASRRHLAVAHTLRRAGAVAQAFPEPFSMCGVAAEGWLTVPSVLALAEKAAFASATSSRKGSRTSSRKGRRSFGSRSRMLAMGPRVAEITDRKDVSLFVPR